MRTDMERYSFCFFFNDTATTEIYTLSLHAALPICPCAAGTAYIPGLADFVPMVKGRGSMALAGPHLVRSEEHTSELQSRQYLVCRLLLEKKNTTRPKPTTSTLDNTLSGNVTKAPPH